jgi:hypothetical protein
VSVHSKILILCISCLIVCCKNRSTGSEALADEASDTSGSAPLTFTCKAIKVWRNVQISLTQSSMDTAANPTWQASLTSSGTLTFMVTTPAGPAEPVSA